MKRIKLFQKKRYTPEARQLIRKNSSTYPSVPLSSLSQVAKLVDLSKRKISHVKAPLLIMQSPEDHLISLNSKDFIIQHARSSVKEVFDVPDSYHVFIIDKHANMAFQKIYSFIKKH